MSDRVSIVSEGRNDRGKNMEREGGEGRGEYGPVGGAEGIDDVCYYICFLILPVFCGFLFSADYDEY